MGGQHVDVVIVGCGISGIDAAYRLKTQCPHLSFQILERRAQLGGTWDFFNFPGLRSDSDLYTFGFLWYPWKTSQRMAGKEEILGYLNEAVEAEKISRYITYNTDISKASFDSNRALWTLTSTDGRVFTCSFLYMCGGYYQQDNAYTPDFPGVDTFRRNGGEVVHPQHWEATEYTNKRVVVIGSGATAVTMVPPLAETAEHVTVVQRSPSFIMSDPKEEWIWKWVSPIMPTSLLYRLMRWKSIILTTTFYWLFRRFPNWAAKELINGVRGELQGSMSDEEISTHFTPRYNPWDQRICVCPEGDFFAALRSKKVSMVTDPQGIECFTKSGLRTASGVEIDADLVVTATGLAIQNNFPFNSILVDVDGKSFVSNQSMLYRGMQLSGCPNMAFCLGYTNIAWTMKSEIAGNYVCRLLNHMKKHGLAIATPQVDPSVALCKDLPLSSGYFVRAEKEGKLPRRGDRQPWSIRDNYLLDRFMLYWGSMDSKNIKFDKIGRSTKGG